MARIVVLASLATGAVLDLAMSKRRGEGTGETSLLRGLIARLNRKDILLFDRFYTGFYDLEFLIKFKT